MQVSVENLGGLERRVTLSIPAEKIEQDYSKRVKKLASTLKVAGFRPGKVPPQFVMQNYGNDVRDDAVQQEMEATFQEVVAQENLATAGEARFETLVNKPGEDVQFTATFEVIPEIAVPHLKGITIEKYVTIVADADIDVVIDRLRKQRATWSVVNRPAKDGDQLEIDFEGSIDGTPFAGGTGKGMKLELGSKSTIPGFEQGLINAKAGEEVTLNLQFPDDYQSEQLAGKATVFKILVHTVSEAELPSLDDSFVEQLGVKGGVAALRSEIQSNLTRDQDKICQDKLSNQVCDKILELNQFDLPKALLAREMRHLKHEAVERLKNEMKLTKVPDLPDDLFQARAERRVKLGLLLSKVISAYDLKADPTQVRQYVEQLAAPYEHPEAVVDWYFSKRENIEHVQSIVLERQAIAKLLEEASINEKSMSYSELIKLNKE